MTEHTKEEGHIVSFSSVEELAATESFSREVILGQLEKLKKSESPRACGHPMCAKKRASIIGLFQTLAEGTATSGEQRVGAAMLVSAKTIVTGVQRLMRVLGLKAGQEEQALLLGALASRILIEEEGVNVSR